jgi:hypothetical protein
MGLLTTAADIVQATDIGFDDEPIGGLLFSLVGLAMAGYFAWNGLRWSRYSARQRNAVRKEGMTQYVPRFPMLDCVIGIVLGIVFLVGLSISCLTLISRL